MDRFEDYVICNPTVKLTKGKSYTLVDIDSIQIGCKYPNNKQTIVYNSQSCSKFKNGDTILARITPCLENGKIAMCKSNTDYTIGSTELFVFREKEGKSYYEYIYYFLKQGYIRNYLANSMTGASGRQRADIKFLKKMRWKFPNVEYQKKVANILIQYDELIENNNKRIKTLEQMADELYKEWFVKCRFPGYQNSTFKHINPTGWVLGSHNDMLVPDKWHFGPLSEIGIFVRGKNITKDKMIEGEIPVVSAGIEPSGYHNESNVKGVSLTMSASGANAGYLKYNLNDIWAADCSYYQNDSNIWYVYHSLNFIKKAIDNLQVGSAQPHVYPKNINKLCIMIPEQQYIEKFNEMVKPCYREIDLINQKNKNLIKQRDLLLPRLMSGKLKVK